MAEGGVAIDTGTFQVTTAGTREQLSTSGGGNAGCAKTVMIQALGTNEGEIVVGDNFVVAAPGTHAAPKQRGIALAAKAFISIDINDTTQIWLDTTKSGDGVSYMVLLS
jgi:hypothetical protein